jgi:hypothetical protein
MVIEATTEIATDRGPLRPERCILYAKPFLLLWHYDGARAGEHITEAELLALEKTARRLEVLLRLAVDLASFTPVAWTIPERIRFTTSVPIVDHQAMSTKLQRGERLIALTLGPDDVLLEFERCRT